MDPNSYQAYIAGEAGPDSPYRFGPTPSKYVQHMAKIAPVGRSLRATGPATGPPVAALSPYDNPCTAIARPVANTSIEASTPAATLSLATTNPTAGLSTGVITRPKSPPLTTAGSVVHSSNAAATRTVDPVHASAKPVAGPSNAADEAAVSLPIATNARPVTPALFAGSDGIHSSPSNSTSRSSSPDAVKLISSLANYKSLSDDALYDTALNAKQALMKWHDEYTALNTEISRMRKSSHNSENKHNTDPRRVEEFGEHGQNHRSSLQQPTAKPTQMTGSIPQNMAKPRAINPINKSPFKGHKPRNELHIDMNQSMQPVEGKRIRKPRVIDSDDTAVTAPGKTAKRAREHDDNVTNASVTDPPATKKQDTRARSITPPEWVHTARSTRSETKEPSAAPETVSKKRARPAKGVFKPVIKQEPVGEAKGRDSVRAAAARLMWAKRQANGTNGRHGGASRDSMVAKAEGK